MAEVGVIGTIQAITNPLYAFFNCNAKLLVVSSLKNLRDDIANFRLYGTFFIFFITVIITVNSAILTENANLIICYSILKGVEFLSDYEIALLYTDKKSKNIIISSLVKSCAWLFVFASEISTVFKTLEFSMFICCILTTTSYLFIERTSRYSLINSSTIMEILRGSINYTIYGFSNGLKSSLPRIILLNNSGLEAIGILTILNNVIRGFDMILTPYKFTILADSSQNISYYNRIIKYINITFILCLIFFITLLDVPNYLSSINIIINNQIIVLFALHLYCCLRMNLIEIKVINNNISNIWRNCSIVCMLLSSPCLLIINKTGLIGCYLFYIFTNILILLFVSKRLSNQ